MASVMGAPLRGVDTRAGSASAAGVKCGAAQSTPLLFAVNPCHAVLQVSGTQGDPTPIPTPGGETLWQSPQQVFEAQLGFLPYVIMKSLLHS